MKQTYLLEKEFITLGQFLKDITVISSGGMAKWYLKENTIYIDSEPENRRGRKIYAGMNVEVPDVGIFFIKDKNEE